MCWLHSFQNNFPDPFYDSIKKSPFSRRLNGNQDSNESYWEGEIDYGQSTKTIIKKVELDAVVEENLEDVSGEATIGINRNGFNGQSSLDLESSLDENNTPN